MSGVGPYTHIGDLQVGWVNVVLIVVRLRMPVYPQTFDVYSWVVGDGSARTVMNVTDSRGSWLQPGDVVRARGAYAYVSHGEVFLHVCSDTEMLKIGECSADPRCTQYSITDFTIFDHIENGFYYIAHFIYHPTNNASLRANEPQPIENGDDDDDDMDEVD